MKLRHAVTPFVAAIAVVAALGSASYGLRSESSGDAGENDAAAATLRPVPPAPFPCARFAPGSIVQNPPDLFSQNGKLVVNLSYQTIFSQWGQL